MSAEQKGSIKVCLAGEQLLACASGALFLPVHKTLVVADLHLGKAERNARRGGGFWPPYEGQETLARLSADVSRYAPRDVVALGDSFDDQHAVENLDQEVRDRIKNLAMQISFIWIAGNHDPVPHRLPGACLVDTQVGALTLRHIADPGAAPGELSGHYHPKLTMKLKGRRIARKCFLADSRRIILPAYGAYTGGMCPDEAPLPELFDREGEAILTGGQMARIPLKRSAFAS